MAECNIEITINGVTYTFHSDAEVDSFILENQSQLSEGLEKGFNKIYSLDSKNETISKLMKAKSDYLSKVGLDKDSVSIGVTPLWDMYYPFTNEQEKKWKEEEKIIKDNPGKYIASTDVGSEADNVLNSIFGKKIEPSRYLTKDMQKTLIESWTKYILPRLRSMGIKISDWKTQCFSQVGLQIKSWNDDFTDWISKNDEYFKDSLTEQKRMAKEISTIRGVADLIIVDDDGVVHVIDFKTANNVGKDPVEFLKWHSRYSAQVQLYEAICRQYDLPIGEGFLVVYETHYTVEENDDKRKLRLDDITFNPDYVIRIPSSGAVSDVVTKFFWTAPEVKETTMESVSNMLNESFPDTPITSRLQAKELDYSFMTEHGIHEVKRDDPEYKKGNRFYFIKNRKFTNTKRHERVYGKTKSELVNDRVGPDGSLIVAPYRKYVNELNAWKSNKFKHFADDLQYAMSIHSEDDFRATIDIIAPNNSNTLMHHFRRYIKGGWKFKANDVCNSNGIYLFEKGTRLEIIVVDDEQPINKYYKFNGNTSIVGNYINDGSLTDTRTVMQASYGNMMLMKACAILAMQPELTKSVKVSNIKALNFRNSRVFEENNSRLIQNWNLLAELYSRNHKEEKPVRKLGYSTFEDDVKAAMDIADEYLEFLFNSDRKYYKSLIDQRRTDKELTRESLINLLHEVQHFDKDRKLSDFRKINYLSDDSNIQKAYAYINRALLAVEKINIFQENDLGSVLRGINLSGINMRSFNESKSALARQMGDLIMRFNTGVRLEFVKEQFKWSKLIDAAYKERNNSGVIGNDWDFFDSWFEKEDDGKTISNKFRLLRPEKFKESHGPAEIAAYEHFIAVNAKYRWPSDAEREDVIDSDSDELYEVPLMAAGFIEQLTKGQPLAALRHSWNKFKNESIDVILGVDNTDPNKHEGNEIERTRRELEKIDADSLSNIVYKEGSEREAYIERNGVNYLEKNLDLVFLNALFAGIRSERSPLFCELFTAMLVGADYMMDTSGLDIVEVRKAMEKFIASKFFLRDIRNPETEAINGILGILKSITANVALGWNTRAFFREVLGGQKKHFNRWLANAENPFIKGTKKFFKTPDFLDYANFVECYKDVVAKIFENTNIFGFYSQLNSIFGMVNFSGHEMIESSKRHQWTVLGLPNKASVTSTAPDFLHRMAILGGHLKTIGAWDAYSKNSEGRLVYDMHKDQQYQTWLNYKDNEKFPTLQERAKYEAEKQHYNEALESWNQSGYSLKYGDLLPQALSPMETARIKNFADTQYGNYDDETKSLIQKQTLGSLFFQYKTYGLAQFQLWFSNPTFVNQLTYKNLLDENGEELVAVPPVTDEEYMEEGDFKWYPVSQVTEEMWNRKGTHYVKVLSGEYFMGKLQTNYLIATHLFTLSGDEFRALWESNPQYRVNLYISMLDLLEFAIIGLLLRLFWGTDDTPIYHQDFISRWTYGVLQGASTDGPLFQTISGIVGDGTPPVFGMIKNYYRTFTSIINGNESLLYGLTNTLGMTRELSNAFRSTIK